MEPNQNVCAIFDKIRLCIQNKQWQVEFYIKHLQHMNCVHTLVTTVRAVSAHISGVRLFAHFLVHCATNIVRCNLIFLLFPFHSFAARFRAQ